MIFHSSYHSYFTTANYCYTSYLLFLLDILLGRSINQANLFSIYSNQSNQEINVAKTRSSVSLLIFLLYTFCTLSIEWQTTWRKMMMTAKICLKTFPSFVKKKEIVVTWDAFCHRLLPNIREDWIQSTTTTILSISSKELYWRTTVNAVHSLRKKKDDNENPLKSIRDFNHLNWWRTVTKPMIEEDLYSTVKNTMSSIEHPLKDNIPYFYKMTWQNSVIFSNKLYKVLLCLFFIFIKTIENCHLNFHQALIYLRK